MIGILGGTFNPIHYGHLRTAYEIKQLFDLTEVRLIPCANPPHRQAPTVAADIRLHMVQLAVANCPGLIADGCEIMRSGPSYTVLTLQQLRTSYNSVPLLLFMGMDAFVGLKQWYQWPQLFELAHIVVMTRPGFPSPPLPSDLTSKQVATVEHLQQTLHGGLWFQPVTQLDISATNIRHLIASGQDPRFLLPDNVLEYIRQEKLYQ